MNFTEQLQNLERQFRSHESKWTLLSSALSVTVPLYLAEFQQRGGIIKKDIDRVQSYLKDLTEHGDDLYFRSQKQGETAARFDQVAEIIAVLAFSPGGITIFGLHFDARSFAFQSQDRPIDQSWSEEEEKPNA